DALSDDFRFGIAEHALAGGIEGAQRAVLLDREHDVLDVIEDDLQVLGALLARRVLERSRLLRHQAHGLGDAAPLGLDALVMIVHQAQHPPRSFWGFDITQETEPEDRRAALTGGGALRGGLGRLLGETRPHDDRYREGLSRGFAGGIHAEDGADREDPVLLWQDLDAVEDRNALHGALGGRDLAAGDELEPVPDLDLAGDPV